MPYPLDEIEKGRQRELNIHISTIVNSAPDIADFVDANMKAYSFPATTTRRMYGYADLEHDYVTGTSLGLHLHIAPATAAAGNMKFQFYVQWTEANALWLPPVLYTAVIPSAGGGFPSQMINVDIPGAGHTWNSRLRVHFFRDPSDVQDTYPDAVFLTALGCHYTAKLSDDGV